MTPLIIMQQLYRMHSSRVGQHVSIIILIIITITNIIIIIIIIIIITTTNRL